MIGEKRWYLRMRSDGNEWIEVTILEVSKTSVVYCDDTGSSYERRTTVPSFCFHKEKPFSIYPK